jgi:hypothetical protein
MTAAEELALIDTAITNLITGGAQSYSISGGGGAGRSITKLSYSQLVQRKKELEIAIARQSSTGSCPVAQFRKPD